MSVQKMAASSSGSQRISGRINILPLNNTPSRIEEGNRKRRVVNQIILHPRRKFRNANPVKKRRKIDFYVGVKPVIKAYRICNDTERTRSSGKSSEVENANISQHEYNELRQNNNTRVSFDDTERRPVNNNSVSLRVENKLPNCSHYNHENIFFTGNRLKENNYFGKIAMPKKKFCDVNPPNRRRISDFLLGRKSVFFKKVFKTKDHDVQRNRSRGKCSAAENMNSLDGNQFQQEHTELKRDTNKHVSFDKHLTSGEKTKPQEIDVSLKVKNDLSTDSHYNHENTFFTGNRLKEKMYSRETPLEQKIQDKSSDSARTDQTDSTNNSKSDNNNSNSNESSDYEEMFQTKLLSYEDMFQNELKLHK